MGWNQWLSDSQNRSRAVSELMVPLTVLVRKAGDLLPFRVKVIGGSFWECGKCGQWIPIKAWEKCECGMFVSQVVEVPLCDPKNTQKWREKFKRDL